MDVLAFENIRMVSRMLRKYGRKSIFSKGFISMGLAVFILIMLTVAFVYLYSCNTKDAANTESYARELYSVRNRFDSVCGLLNEKNDAICRNSDVLAYLRGEDNEEKVQEFLSSERLGSGFLSSIYLYVPQKEYIISTSRLYKSGNMEEFADTSWRSLYKKGIDFSYREYPEVGIIAKVFSFIRKIECDNGNEAVLIYNVDYSKLNFDSNLLKKSRLYFIDRNDNILYSSELQYLGDKLGNAENAIPQYDKNGVYVTEYKMAKSIYIYVSMKNRDVGLMLVSDRKWTEGIPAFVILLAILLALFVSMFISLLLTTRLYKPLTNMLDIDNGLDTRVIYGEDNEINEFIEYVFRLKDEKQHIESEFAQSAMMLQNTQVAALQSQLNPHFLFNTLQLLSAIIMAEFKRDTEAVRVISLISSLLREAIDVSEFFRPLSKETELSKKYIEIQKIRYPDKFSVEWDIEEGTESLKVPKCILQPILENSIAYGILRLKEKGVIRIRSFLKNGKLIISVYDNGVGFTADRLLEVNNILSGVKHVTKKNIGLYNIDRRIKVLFGESYGLTVKSENGAEVIITLPAEKYENTGRADSETP